MNWPEDKLMAAGRANNRITGSSKISTHMRTLVTAMMLLAAISMTLADSSVAEVQQTLKDQGYYYGEINGKKDADTTAAIRRYQIRNGLQISGDLNDETLKSIRSAPSVAAQSPAPQQPRTTPPPQTESDTSDLRAETAPPNQQPANPPTQLQPPSDGDQWQLPPNVGRRVPSGSGLFSGTPYETAPIEVQRRVITDAQRILAGRGLFRDRVDGAFGPSLEFSLRAYQSRVGLPTTGRLDLETLAALELLPGAHTPIFTPRHPARGPLPPVRGEWVRP